MQHYRDLNGDSGVAAFEIESEAMNVQFKDGSVYRYTYASAGRQHLERMKSLALAGDGLNSYINRYVRQGYSEKLR